MNEFINVPQFRRGSGGVPRARVLRVRAMGGPPAHAPHPGTAGLLRPACQLPGILLDYTYLLLICY